MTKLTIKQIMAYTITFDGDDQDQNIKDFIEGMETALSENDINDVKKALNINFIKFDVSARCENVDVNTEHDYSSNKLD